MIGVGLSLKHNPKELWDRLFPLKTDDYVHVRFRAKSGDRLIDFYGIVYKLEGRYVYATCDNFIEGLSRGTNWMLERKDVRKVK